MVGEGDHSVRIEDSEQPAAGADDAMALTATHLSASAAGLTWAVIEWKKFGRPSMVGLVTGVVGGLATITPASGCVGPVGGVILDVAASLVCFAAVEIVKHRWRIDDSLGVFAVHGVGGILGSLLVAVLARPAFGGVGYGSVGTMARQAAVQVEGVVTVLAWSAAATLALLFVTRKLTGLRAKDEDIDDGLDLSTHGERDRSLRTGHYGGCGRLIGTAIALRGIRFVSAGGVREGSSNNGLSSLRKHPQRLSPSLAVPMLLWPFERIFSRRDSERAHRKSPG
jgi:hypothetical protein